MKYFLVSILAIIIIVLYSCQTCHNPEGEVHENYVANFFIYNALTDSSIYAPQYNISSCDSAGEYCPDSLKLFDSNFNSIPIYHSPDDKSPYYFYYLPVYDEKIDFLAKSQIISKLFYLKLNYLDIDTIELKYSLRYIKECGYHVFSNDNAFYNNKPMGVIENVFKFKK